MVTTTTSLCQNESLIGKSEIIIKDRTKNPYYNEYDNMIRSYNSLVGNDDISKKNLLIKSLLDLNIRVNSIINCKKEENKNQTESNIQLTKVINPVAPRSWVP